MADDVKAVSDLMAAATNLRNLSLVTNQSTWPPGLSDGAFTRLTHLHFYGDVINTRHLVGGVGGGMAALREASLGNLTTHCFSRSSLLMSIAHFIDNSSSPHTQLVMRD